MRLPLALLLLGTLAACGPIKSSKAIASASDEVEVARSAGAARTAPYEYTAAEAYLHQAQLVQGRSEYDAATEFAEKAEAMAIEAAKKARAATSKPAGPR